MKESFLRSAALATIAASLSMTGAVGVVSGSTDQVVAIGSVSDQQAVAALDTQYQAAVKNNDAAEMNRLLADDFVLVTGSGKAFTKADLLDEARSGRRHYEHQEDTEQIVRVWGATAVVTARLWAKGTDRGQPFEYVVWFSDTYVRTPAGWRYSFGQASLPLPKLTQ
jgi:ketosteroid isomerase-like protein